MSYDEICSKFITAVEEYSEIQNGNTIIKIRDALDVITKSCSINRLLFKSTIEKSHFLLSVRLALVKIGIICDHSLLMLALKAIKKLCNQTELKNELIETQEMLLILVELLEKFDNIEANSEILNLLQELTFNLNDMEEYIKVNKLVTTLAMFIKRQPTEHLLFSALACLINLCHKNTMALQKLNNLLNLTEFAKHLLVMRCKTISSKVHGFHMLLLTWFETGKRHYEEKDVFIAIEIIYDAIEHAYTNEDLHLFKHTMDLLIDMAEEDKLVQDINAYPKHAEKVLHLIKHVTPTAATSEYSKEILLFLQALISNVNPESFFNDVISASSIFISKGNNRINCLNLFTLMIHRKCIVCDQTERILTEETVLFLLKMIQQTLTCTDFTNIELDESYQVFTAILELHMKIDYKTDVAVSLAIKLFFDMMERAMKLIAVECVDLDQSNESCVLKPVELDFYVEAILYAKTLESRYDTRICSEKFMDENTSRINYILVMGILHGDEITKIRVLNFIQSSLNIDPVSRLLVKFQSDVKSTNKITLNESGFDESLFKKSKFCRRLKDSVENTNSYLLEKNELLNSMQPYLMDTSKKEYEVYALKSTNKQNRYRITMLEREVCLGNKELDVITTCCAMLNNEKIDLVSQLNCSGHLIHHIQTLQSKMQENMERWDITILDLKSRLEHEQSQVKISKECIEQLNDSISNLKCTIRQKDHGITVIDTKIAACEGVIADLEVTIADKEREIDTYVNKIAILTNCLTEKEEESLKVEDQITELQRLRDAINTMTSTHTTSYSLT